MTIDLSQFVGKKVRVTFRNGETYEGNITPNEFDDSSFPYRFQPNEDVYFRNFNVTGSQSVKCHGAFDIMKIEEINEIEELENKVKELQAEIDRLKSQDQKEVPKIRCIEVTRTNVYDPEFYLQYCEESGVIPTQEGFIDYIADQFDHDFSDEYFEHQEIKELGEWN